MIQKIKNWLIGSKNRSSQTDIPEESKLTREEILQKQADQEKRAQAVYEGFWKKEAQQYGTTAKIIDQAITMSGAHKGLYGFQYNPDKYIHILRDLLLINAIKHAKKI